MLLPYSIFFDADNVAYFTADNKAAYKALFSGLPIPGLPELEGFVFDFSFQRNAANCVNPSHPGRDERVRLTLEKLLNRFFELSPYGVLSFVCDSTDDKHKARQRVFNDWHAPHKASIKKLTFSLPSGDLQKDGTPGEIVGGLFYLRTHPLASQIEAGLAAEIAVYTMAKADS